MNKTHQHADLATISDMFRANGVAEEEQPTSGNYDAAAGQAHRRALSDGQLQQQQQQQQQEEEVMDVDRNQQPLQQHEHHQPQQQQHGGAKHHHSALQQPQPTQLSLLPQQQLQQMHWQQQQQQTGRVTAGSSPLGAPAGSAGGIQQHTPGGAVSIDEIEIS
jgi:hypothetical protein